MLFNNKSFLNKQNFDEKTCQIDLNGIITHLNNLLNTIQGSVNHLPDYGLPDINMLYENMPSSIRLFSSEIENVIKKYEPRIEVVVVKLYPNLNKGSILTFHLSCMLRNGKEIDFSVDFNAERKTSVKALVKER